MTLDTRTISSATYNNHVICQSHLAHLQDLTQRVNDLATKHLGVAADQRVKITIGPGKIQAQVLNKQTGAPEGAPISRIVSEDISPLSDLILARVESAYLQCQAAHHQTHGGSALSSSSSPSATVQMTSSTPLSNSKEVFYTPRSSFSENSGLLRQVSSLQAQNRQLEAQNRQLEEELENRKQQDEALRQFAEKIQ
jgi:hypothetical protein